MRPGGGGAFATFHEAFGDAVRAKRAFTFAREKFITCALEVNEWIQIGEVLKLEHLRDHVQ